MLFCKPAFDCLAFLSKGAEGRERFSRPGGHQRVPSERAVLATNKTRKRIECAARGVLTGY
jgi:hypothetical protein